MAPLTEVGVIQVMHILVLSQEEFLQRQVNQAITAQAGKRGLLQRISDWRAAL